MVALDKHQNLFTMKTTGQLILLLSLTFLLFGCERHRAIINLDILFTEPTGEVSVPNKVIELLLPHSNEENDTTFIYEGLFLVLPDSISYKNPVTWRTKLLKEIAKNPSLITLKEETRNHLNSIVIPADFDKSSSSIITSIANGGNYDQVVIWDNQETVELGDWEVFAQVADIKSHVVNNVYRKGGGAKILVVAGWPKGGVGGVPPGYGPGELPLETELMKLRDYSVDKNLRIELAQELWQNDFDEEAYVVMQHGEGSPAKQVWNPGEADKYLARLAGLNSISKIQVTNTEVDANSGKISGLYVIEHHETRR